MGNSFWSPRLPSKFMVKTKTKPLEYSRPHLESEGKTGDEFFFNCWSDQDLFGEIPTSHIWCPGSRPLGQVNDPSTLPCRFNLTSIFLSASCSSQGSLSVRMRFVDFWRLQQVLVTFQLFFASLKLQYDLYLLICDRQTVIWSRDFWILGQSVKVFDGELAQGW